MEIPLSIKSRQVSIPPKVESLIRKKASGLERFYQPVVRCQVLIEGPGRRHRTGGSFGVRVDVTVPGAELTVDRQESEDLAAAVHGAFNAARRQLQDHARIQRGATKRHEPRVEEMQEAT